MREITLTVKGSCLQKDGVYMSQARVSLLAGLNDWTIEEFARLSEKKNKTTNSTYDKELIRQSRKSYVNWCIDQIKQGK